MGKILAIYAICLACLVGSGLSQVEGQNRFSHFLSGSEIPEVLQTGQHIVFFGAAWCTWCPVQKAILRTMEEEVTYFDADKDVELYNHLRGTERRIPLTIILVDGKIKKRYVGVHPAIRIKRGLKKEVSYKQDKSRLSILLRGTPIWLGKYADLWKCNAIVYFGNKYCSSCPQQRAILKGLEKEGFRVKYYSANNDKALYDYLRKGEERVPLTIIFAEGKIQKTFVGVTSSLWIRPQAKKYKCNGDCDSCKDATF